jgi:multiple sugar transport system permease protein
MDGAPRATARDDMATTLTKTSRRLPDDEPGKAAPPRRRRRRLRPHRFAYAMLAPALAFMLVVHVIPTLGGVYLSFLNLNTFTFPRLFSAPWAALENYRAILFEPDNPLHSGFVDAARNTVIYTGATVALSLAAGLGIALLMNREFPGQRVVRTLMLAPWVVPTFVVALLWQFMWQSDAGIINKVLVDYLGVLDNRPVWLLGSNALWAVIVPSVWRGIPFAMLFFLAALQAIPKDLHEAAAIDGAGPFKRFRYITLPLLRPVIAIQLLFGVIYSAYQFTMPYIMLGNNPGESADLIMTLIVRQSFSNNLVGFGAAVSTLLTLAMMVWVAVWYVGFRRDLEGARA